MIEQRLRAFLCGCVVVTLCLGVATAASDPPAPGITGVTERAAIGYAADELPAASPGVAPQLLQEELGDLLEQAASAGASVATAADDTRRADAPGAPIPNKQIQCVEGRQTADPLAPPCVGGFGGDNGAATWRGVTRDEVRVVLQLAGNAFMPDPALAATRRVGRSLYVDLDRPLPTNAPLGVRTLQWLSEYFNRRFETYGRRVRVVVHFGDPFDAVTDQRHRALAAEHDIRVRPYAVAYAHYDKGLRDTSHAVALAERGIVHFDVRTRFRTVADRYPAMLWSLRPSPEYHATLVSSYICRKVVDHPVSMSGNLLDNGRPRVLSMVRPGAASPEEWLTLAALVKEQVAACGGTFVDDLVYPAFNGCVYDQGALANYIPTALAEYTDRAEREATIAENIARVRSQGATTLIWPSCAHREIGIPITASGWRPEWILSGDGAFDRTYVPSEAWFTELFNRRAVIVTSRTYERPLLESLCARAIREVAPEADDYHDLLHGCRSYPILRQLFTAIQVAGPTLRPGTMKEGFERFPAVESTDPEVPTCLYVPGEYSCTKDAQVQWWDSSPNEDAPRLIGDTPVPGVGCWRSIAGGRRYLPGTWPGGNIDAQITWDEPCSAAYTE